MAELYTQLALNSTGNKMRENERVIGSNTVREQSVFQTPRESYLVLVEDSAFALNKHHLSIFNGVGSAKIVRISKLFITNMLANVAVTGGARRIDVKKITNLTAGTDIPVFKMDSLNLGIPAQILIKTNTSVSEGAIMFPLVFPDDEMLITQNSAAQQLFSGINWIPEGIEIQEITLREGEGMTVKQITSSVAGIVSWIVVFTLEDA